MSRYIQISQFLNLLKLTQQIQNKLHIKFEQCVSYHTSLIITKYINNK